MSFTFDINSSNAVSFPYAYIGGKEPIEITLVVTSGGQSKTNAQTVTFDDPLPENPDELIVFPGKASVSVTITVDTLSAKDLAFSKEDKDGLIIVKFHRAKEGPMRESMVVLALFVCPQQPST